MKSIDDLLKNYQDLVSRVDLLCSSITSRCADAISCRKGCDECCRHFTVSWVEAVNMAKALKNLPTERLSSLRQRAETLVAEDVCPLLDNGACSLYSARPIICRTHGLPILVTEGDKRLIDFCPRNFMGTETISGDMVVNLDHLNTALAAVDSLFVSRFFKGALPPVERPAIVDALFFTF